MLIFVLAMIVLAGAIFSTILGYMADGSYGAWAWLDIYLALYLKTLKFCWKVFTWITLIAFFIMLFSGGDSSTNNNYYHDWDRLNRN